MAGTDAQHEALNDFRVGFEPHQVPETRELIAADVGGGDAVADADQRVDRLLVERQDRRPRTRRSSATGSRRRVTSLRAWASMLVSRAAPARVCKRSRISGSMALWRSGDRSSRASALVTTSGAAVSRSSSRQSESARSRSGKSFRTSPSTRPSSRPGRIVRRRSICRRSGFELQHRAREPREHHARDARIERGEQRRHVAELLGERVCRRLRVRLVVGQAQAASTRATMDRRRAARDRRANTDENLVAGSSRTQPLSGG